MFDDLDVVLFGICDVLLSCFGYVIIVCVLLVVYYFLLNLIVIYYCCFLCIRVKLLDVSVNEVFGVVISGEVDFGVSFMGS